MVFVRGEGRYSLYFLMLNHESFAAALIAYKKLENTTLKDSEPGIKPGAAATPFLCWVICRWPFFILQVWMCEKCREKHVLNIVLIFVTLLGITKKCTNAHLHYWMQNTSCWFAIWCVRESHCGLDRKLLKTNTENSLVKQQQAGNSDLILCYCCSSFCFLYSELRTSAHIVMDSKISTIHSKL